MHSIGARVLRGRIPKAVDLDTTSVAQYPRGSSTASVVIAARNEEYVLGRCLDALVRLSQPNELEIVVVCNGCTDRTADIARGYGEAVRVIETPIASKTAALNVGDAHVSAFPRFYVDADVVLPIESIRRIAARLVERRALAASPGMSLDLHRSTVPVRAYYRIWVRMPYVREGMIGVGVYALSEQGRRRFGEFPEIIADDGYVRMLFDVRDRLNVADAPVHVFAPQAFSDLVRIKTRSRLGRYQLRQRFPELFARERSTKSYRRAIWGIVTRPWLWPAAVFYTAVLVETRRRARPQLNSFTDYVWERDQSSRRPDRH
jgi:glycosyltransferase involved in cell wall biosynthesis